MGRTFLIAVLAGALAAVIGLASFDLAGVSQQPAQLEPAGDAGTSTERWMIEARDRIAATGDGLQPVPAGIATLRDARLAGLNVATMKVRNVSGEVVGVASRITANEQDLGVRAVWWTFVMGTRGTLAAYLPDQAVTGGGQLLGGTRSFDRASGQFSEERQADGGYRLRLTRMKP